MATRGRPSTGKYDNVVEVIRKYTEETEYPILKEVCYLNDFNYDTIMKMQRDNEELMQSIKRLLNKKESYLEREGVKGKINQTMAVFTLKQLGWRDKIEVDTNEKENSKLDEILKEIKDSAK